MLWWPASFLSPAPATHVFLKWLSTGETAGSWSLQVYFNRCHKFSPKVAEFTPHSSTWACFLTVHANDAILFLWTYWTFSAESHQAGYDQQYQCSIEIPLNKGNLWPHKCSVCTVYSNCSVVFQVSHLSPAHPGYAHSLSRRGSPGEGGALK